MTGTVDSQSTESEVEDSAEEPRFKYKRLLNDLVELFKTDAASCIAVHERYIVLGTQWGKIVVLDHDGNIIADKCFAAHSVAVNQISIDRTGEHLASCSNDGKAVIYGLFSQEQSRCVALDRPVRSIAIDPNFARTGSGQQFVTGDRVLILHERSIFARNKQQLLFVGKERDGYIHRISWQDSMIAFANETGVLVFDNRAKVLITQVLRRHELTWRCELLPAHIQWFDSSSFMIAWANTLTICAIRDSSVVSSEFPNKLVEVRFMWEFPDHFISGVSYTPCLLPHSQSRTGMRGNVKFLPRWQELILFTLSMANSSNPMNFGDCELFQRAAELELERPQYPRVVLVETVNFQEFSVFSEDIIEMKDSEMLSCHQYHFSGLPGDQLYYLLGTKDLIQMRRFSEDDHVGWLLNKGRFRKALDYAKEHETNLTKYSSLLVGRQYLEHLLVKGRFENAAQICITVCGRRKDLWEYYVTRFEQVNQLSYLIGVLPTHDPQLEPECYQSVLLELLGKDASLFRRTIIAWPAEIYRVSAMINETVRQLQKSKESPADLLSALACLYTHEKRYEQALAIYLKLNDKNVFALIERAKLFPLVKDRIHQLIAVDPDLAIRLLLENEDSLSPSTVMKQLIRLPKLQLAYLERLFARGEGEQQFADTAVLLYAEHNRSRLLGFLQDCEHYTLDKALEACKQRQYVAETVFLLAKSGNHQEALRSIIADLGDIGRAIEFCVEHDDADLWRALVDHSVCNDSFLLTLMRRIGVYVDPRLVIERIPANRQVQGFRDALAVLMRDYSIHLELMDNSKRVQERDCYRRLTDLIGRNRRSTRLQERDQCSICSTQMVCFGRSPEHGGSELIVFHCHHAFHLKCLRDDCRTCPTCYKNA
ncbi:Vacuolar protein sorting-associated protein 41 -like protein [Trichinella murrelli]|uniref:Vacuolar protein sorting-associated protein 41-like protein n=1 Tax=Trichinella murrelli TaxID=144512 RepID=A0A0V0U7D5_9BILA|nr:Vacuolar protein sorting-associated protein 41 -like protein [Trichinella murrelli]